MNRKFLQTALRELRKDFYRQGFPLPAYVRFESEPAFKHWFGHAIYPNRICVDEKKMVTRCQWLQILLHELVHLAVYMRWGFISPRNSRQYITGHEWPFHFIGRRVGLDRGTGATVKTYKRLRRLAWELRYGRK